MKNKYCYCLFVCCFLILSHTVAIQAQDRPTVKTSTIEIPDSITTISFEEFMYDFGKVKEGSKVTHVFPFTNTGNHPLTIIGARGSCGCTVPLWPKDPIAPGESASITVVFNTTRKFGKRNQKITIISNTDPQNTFVYLQGEIEQREKEEEVIEKVIDVMDEKYKSDCFIIYPNPTTDLIRLKVDQEGIGQQARVSIFSQNGQLMAQRNIPSIGGDIEFSVQHYPAGNYMANVKIGNQPMETQCFVVTK